MLPGRPFWAAFTAFAANMAALLAASSLDLNWLGVEADLLATIVVSAFVAAVVYGEAKLADLNGAGAPPETPGTVP